MSNLMEQSQNPQSLKVNTSAFITSKRVYWLLFSSQLLNFSLVSGQLSLWMLAIISLSLLWRAAVITNQLPQPSKWLLIAFALVGCIVLALLSKKLGLLLTMVHLLCFAYALKQLELVKYKDFYELILIGLFIIAAAMIFDQNLYFAVFIFFVFLINISVLFSFSVSGLSYLIAFKGTLKLIVQSIPFTIILFVLFPRLTPFWQVPLAHSAKTGLSDHVSAGDIAQLIRSTDLAFRVHFFQQKPYFNDLYWRAIVLDEYDGNSWKKSKASIRLQKLMLAHPSQRKINNVGLLSTQITYQVIVQPSYQHWLFSLLVPQVNNSSIFRSSDNTLLNKKPITQSMSYQVTSYRQSQNKLTLSAKDKKQYLQRPPQANPRLVAYAKSLRKTTSTNQAFIAKILQHIRTHNYRYTLTPPLLKNHSLDQFYFDTKAGFCVHYASSFTFLMRAAGIPARLVTGYMGGEYNANADYYSLYQYDAHAWSEVWLNGRGWVRVDPTAAVSPERIEKGFSRSLFTEQSLLDGNLFSLQHYRNIAWLNYVRQQLGALDYRWTRWVIGYTPDRQLKLLHDWFGGYKLWQIALFVVLLCSAVLLWLWLTNREAKIRSTQQSWQNLYAQALRLLQKKGINRSYQQSTEDFCQKVYDTIPEAGDDFKLLTNNFVNLNYKTMSKLKQQQQLQLMKDNWQILKRKVKKF